MKFSFDFFTLILILICLFCSSTSSYIFDDNGYIMYCPCMGRFGNQADHFLGAFAFAHGLNRTLVLPPWVEYRFGEPKSIQVNFDQYFQITPLSEYHRVITMKMFMSDLANSIWPPENRTAFCYISRGSPNSSFKTCNAKEGNPFGPFWDTYDVNFTSSEFYAPLHYDIYRDSNIEKWKSKYTANKWPVIAFTGAPASFPVQEENRHLQKYMKWNDSLLLKAKQFIKKTMPDGGFIGIHLRNGADWVKACQHVSDSPLLFAAPQCVGYRNERGPLTPSMCFPSKQDIIRHLKRVLKQNKDVRHIFVASDANHMIEELSLAHKRQKISFHKLAESNPHLDLVILGRSNHFIGNCVSSFSAFVKRERDTRRLPSSFWAFPSVKSLSHREEL